MRKPFYEVAGFDINGIKDVTIGTELTMRFGPHSVDGIVTKLEPDRVFVDWKQDIFGNPFSQWHKKRDLGPAPRSSIGVGIFMKD